MEPLRERVDQILSALVGYKALGPALLDAIMQSVNEDRAALMAVAEKNENYEEAIEQDRDKWRNRSWKAENERDGALRDVAQLHDAAVETEAKLEAADYLAQEVVWLLDNVRAIQSSDKSEEWWTRRNAMLARLGNKP